jgi:hypothetical protein
VANNFEKHKKLYNEDTKRKELIKKKQEEEKAKKAAAQPKPTPKVQEGATVEEIDDEEAKRLELQSIFQKQQQAKKDKEANKDKKKEDGDDKEEENFLQKPNSGNGGQTEKYVWHQTLQEVSAYVPLP